MYYFAGADGFDDGKRAEICVILQEGLGRNGRTFTAPIRRPILAVPHASSPCVRSFFQPRRLDGFSINRSDAISNAKAIFFCRER